MESNELKNSETVKPEQQMQITCHKIILMSFNVLKACLIFDLEKL